jgi:alpha-galactosidase
MAHLLPVSFVTAAALTFAAAAPAQKPNGSTQKLKVYILAGQSNMQGHAKVETLAALADDPATKDLYDWVQTKNGEWRTADDVWISYLTQQGDGDGECRGKLGVGFGARRDASKDDGKIGPEYTFGLKVDQAHDGPVLIIKTAWGGKSLHTDFRPPSAGAYPFSQQQLDQWRKQGKDVEQLQKDKVAATGVYYRKMVDHVRAVLADLPSRCPEYKKSNGYELAGFVWFQGWNDLVDGGTYPQRDQPGGYDAYSECMAHFIRDVRKDLDAPTLPFVIGVMGVDGPVAPGDTRRRTHGYFQQAMAAPAAMPEFAGTVTAVPTAPLWDFAMAAIANKVEQVRDFERKLKNKHKDSPNRDGSMSDAAQKAAVAKFRSELISAAEEAQYARGASNAGYHYLGSGKTFAKMGVKFADAVLEMQKR